MVEDFTTFTEVDPGSKITVTSTKVDHSAIPPADSAYVYKDMGAGHFSGDFIHEFEAYLNSSTSDGVRTNFWAMSNNLDDQDGLNASNFDYFCWSYGDEAASTLLRIYEGDGATEYNDTDSGSSSYRNTIVYMRIHRDESVGTYGTIYAYFYSDSGRTNLVYTQSITLHSSKKDFRYVHAFMGDGRTYAGTSTGYTQNLELNESSASGPANLKSYNTNLKANIKSINTNPIANIKSLNTNV